MPPFGSSTRKASTSCWPTCAHAAKPEPCAEDSPIRDKIKLESTAGTGHFYTTTKNKRNMPEKMEIKKFDPVARKHVAYKETKIKSVGCDEAAADRPGTTRSAPLRVLRRTAPCGAVFRGRTQLRAGVRSARRGRAPRSAAAGVLAQVVDRLRAEIVAG